MSPWLKTIYFLSLLFAALALAPAMAHLLELPNKINLSREDYLKVQQIYRGWALLGFVVVGAFLPTLALTITVRHERKAFILALIAFLCIAGTQVVFWTYTYPANQATNNWIPACFQRESRRCYDSRLFTVRADLRRNLINPVVHYFLSRIELPADRNQDLRLPSESRT